MKNSASWLFLSLIILIAAFVLALIFGDNFLIPVYILSVAFVVFLSLMYRRKSDQLARAMAPDESLIARGLVSESTFDETPAILVRGPGDSCRIHIAGPRGSHVVRAVSTHLLNHPNPKDLKFYLELHTDQGVIHFAPKNTFLVAGQPAYAEEILALVSPGRIGVSAESQGA